MDGLGTVFAVTRYAVRIKGLDVAPVQNDGGAMPREVPGHRPADPAIGPRDKNHTALRAGRYRRFVGAK